MSEQSTNRVTSVTEVFSETVSDLEARRTSLQQELSNLRSHDSFRAATRPGLKFSGWLMILLSLAWGVGIHGIVLIDNVNRGRFEIEYVLFSLLIFFAPAVIAYKLGRWFLELSKGKETSKERVQEIYDEIAHLHEEIGRRVMARKVILAEQERAAFGEAQRIVSGGSAIHHAEERDGKVCPMCAESVKSAAKVCRFCGHKFGETFDG